MKTKTRRYDSSKRKAQAEERRAVIVERAAELLADTNRDEIRLEDVAQAAGVSVQTILRAFGSKDGLVIATLESVAPDAVDFTSFANVEIQDLSAFVHTVFSAYEKIGDLVIRALAESIDHLCFKGRWMSGGLIMWSGCPKSLRRISKADHRKKKPSCSAH